MRIRHIIPLLALFVGAVTATAQDSKRLLSTIGTVIEVDGHHYAYLVWQPNEAATTFGKRFSIYAKNGDIPSPASYTRHGIQTLQTSPGTIRAVLRLGDRIDYRPGAAASQIAKVYQSTTLQLGVMPPPTDDANLDASGKLAYLIAAAANDPQVLDQLFFLGRAHPGVMMALGHAFMIEVPGTGVKTFELREIDATDSDVSVIGRVELDPASPPVPPAPGPPVAVPHPDPGNHFVFSPMDNLNARFRWGMDNALRRMLPFTFGFDLFRVNREVAIAAGWDATPPTREELMTSIAGQNPELPPTIVQPNILPILTNTLLTLPEAASTTDKETFFYADDNGIPMNPPFNDGDSFYYFVAARTLTGHPGEISPGTEVQMCDRMPPRPPKIVSVENVFTRPANPADWATSGGTQHLALKILQLPNTEANESAAGYDIYRWSSSREYLVRGGNPATNLIAHVAHAPGQKFVRFEDTGPGAPSRADDGVTFWYTARAVDLTSCANKNLSAHSAPKYGVIRDRVGPAAPGGDFLVCRFTPTTEYRNRTEENASDYGADEKRIQFRVQAHRDSDMIVSFDVKLEHDKGGSLGLAPISSSNIPFRALDDQGITFPLNPTGNYIISVRGVSANGIHGPWASKTTNLEEAPDTIPYFLSMYHFDITMVRDCRLISEIPEDPGVHEPKNPLDGSVIGIEGGLTFTADVREWRIYRRIGRTGKLGLIAKGEGELVTSPVAWADPHPPATPGTLVCYYGQVFDAHGNPSLLQRLGCTRVENPAIASPLVKTPKLLEDHGNGRGRVKLSWFCDPAGVDRFELYVARADGNPADPTAPALSQRLSDTPLTGITTDPPGLMFFPHQTERLGSNLMGQGPEFLVTMEVPLDTSLYFAVKAVGQGVYNARSTGGTSNVVTATWTTPPPPESPVIPWPERPFPDRFEIEREIADYAPGEGPFYATKFPASWSTAAGILIGVCKGTEEIGEPPGYATNVALPPGQKPEDMLFDLRLSNQDPAAGFEDLIPFMVYRYQLPNELFPNAVPNVVQCTPLIDRLSYKSLGVDIKTGLETFRIRDPFFVFVGFGFTPGVPLSGDFSRTPSVVLGDPRPLPEADYPAYIGETRTAVYVADRLPVIKGARYQYLIISYNERGEIQRVIPVNSVQQ